MEKIVLGLYTQKLYSGGNKVCFDKSFSVVILINKYKIILDLLTLTFK